MYSHAAQTQRNVWSKMTRVAWLMTPLGILLNISPASAAPFDLGAFDTYGLLVNDGAANGDINTAPVDTNIGIGNLATAKTVNLHNEVVNGKVDVEGNAATFVSGRNITGTQPVSRGGASANGSPASVNSNVAAVEGAITTAKALSSTHGAESGSGTAVTINGTTTIQASAGFLDSSGARLFTASSFSIGNGHTVTINGSAADYVVIDITGNSGNKLDGALTLTGGITPDQVLINFLGSGGEVGGAANGATLQGTFLIPNQTVNLNSLTIADHLFGGGRRFPSRLELVRRAATNTSSRTDRPGFRRDRVGAGGLGCLESEAAVREDGALDQNELMGRPRGRPIFLSRRRGPCSFYSCPADSI